MKVLAACATFTVLWFVLLIAALSPVQQADPYRVPDVEGPSNSHYHRPDGKMCNMTTKDHPCDCQNGVTCTDKGEQGEPVEHARCQWYCHPDHCDCLVCP